MKKVHASCLLKMLLVSSVVGLGACGGGDSSSPTGSVAVSTGVNQAPIVIYGGSVVPPAAIGSNGDYYLDTATGQLFGPKANGAWPTVGIALTGPAGPVGLPGATGATGASGANGAAGASLLSGMVVPANTLGNDGDFYLNLSSNSITGPKAQGAWPVTSVSLMGPMGATGAAGANGATGATGAAGNSLLSGNGAPNAAFGSDGDYYIDTVSLTLFGPKAAGAWPGTGITLVGATGATGATGAAGAAGAAGATGATGATGAQGTPGVPGLPGTPGATGSTGATGPAGSTGATGSTGPTGATGAFGVTGSTGATGATGPSGATGATGTGPLVFMSHFVNPVTPGGWYEPIDGAEVSTNGLSLAAPQLYAVQASTMPIACTFTGIYARGVVVQTPAVDSFTITLWKNGVATGLSTTLVVPASLNSITTVSTVGSVSVVSGDSVALYVTQTNTTPYVLTEVTTICQ